MRECCSRKSKQSSIITVTEAFRERERERSQHFLYEKIMLYLILLEHSHQFVQFFIIIYFSIKTLFFYFTSSLFKIPYIRLFILHCISLKCQIFLILKIFFLSSHTITTVHHFRLSSRYVMKEKITKCKMNSVNINLHCCYSKLVNLHKYIWIDVSHF